MELYEEKRAAQIRKAMRKLSRCSKQVHEIKKGDIVVLRYDYYGIETIIVALKDIDLLKEQVNLIVNFKNFMEGASGIVKPLKRLVPNLIRDRKAALVEFTEYQCGYCPSRKIKKGDIVVFIGEPEYDDDGFRVGGPDPVIQAIIVALENFDLLEKQEVDIVRKLIRDRKAAFVEFTEYTNPCIEIED